MIGPKRWARNGWTTRRWVAAALLTISGIAVTSDAWGDMLRIARRDAESSHLFIVPVVIAWLAWVRRGRLRQCSPADFWVGPLIVGCGWLLYSRGDALFLQSLWHGGAVLVAAGCALTVLGGCLLRRFLPAFVALLFLVPVPSRLRQEVAIPLEATTASVTQRLMALTGDSVERAGNVLTLNGVDITIAEACNGLRMVYALTLVSYAFAFGTPLREHTRLIILMASPPLAVACNMARLVPTVWLCAHEPGVLARQIHDWGGSVMLGMSFLALMGIPRVLRWVMVPVSSYSLVCD
jgi:exosortase